MTNLILLSHNRPNLLAQCLRTLYDTTPESQFNLTIIDDCSGPDTTRVLGRYTSKPNCHVVYFMKHVGIVGFLRNVGVWTSERTFGRGEWLCTIDNDIAFKERWLDVMTDRADFGDRVGIKLLGGYRHPFHGLAAGAFTAAMFVGEGIEITDAVAGYMQFMSWSIWDQNGPYDQHSKGVCQSEDFALSRNVCLRGHAVGYVTPPVIVNCGITNSEGNPAIGSEHFPRILGLLYA